MQPEVSIKEGRVDPFKVLVGVGSNLGDREHNMAAALTMLDRTDGCRVLQVSGLWESDPVDAGGGCFLNAVALVATTLPAGALLKVLKSVERGLGRTGSGHDARPIDLDILFFHDSVINSPDLTIPHPRWRGRSFVTIPLASVCGDMTDPLTGERISSLLGNDAPEESGVRLFRGQDWY